MQPLRLGVPRSRWLYDNEMVVAGLSTADSSSASPRPPLLRGDQSLPPPQLSTGYNRVRLREPCPPRERRGKLQSGCDAYRGSAGSTTLAWDKNKTEQPPGHILSRVCVCVCVCACVCVWGLERNAPVANIIARVFFPPSCLTFGANLELGRWASFVFFSFSFFFFSINLNYIWVAHSEPRGQEKRERERERDRERDGERKVLAGAYGREGHAGPVFSALPPATGPR